MLFKNAFIQQNETQSKANSLVTSVPLDRVLFVHMVAQWLHITLSRVEALPN